MRRCFRFVSEVKVQHRVTVNGEDAPVDKVTRLYKTKKVVKQFGNKWDQSEETANRFEGIFFSCASKSNLTIMFRIIYFIIQILFRFVSQHLQQ